MDQLLTAAAAAALGIGFMFTPATAQAIPCMELPPAAALQCIRATPPGGLATQGPAAQAVAPPHTQPAAAPPAPGQQGDSGNHYLICAAQGMCNASGGPAGTPAAAPAPPAAAPPAPAPMTAPNPAIAPSIDNALGAPPPLAPPGPVIAGPGPLDNNGYPAVTTPSDQWQQDKSDYVDEVSGGACNRGSSPTCVPRREHGDGYWVGTTDDCNVDQDGDNCISKNKPPNQDNLAPSAR